MNKPIVLGILFICCTGGGTAQQKEVAPQPVSAAVREPLVMLTGKDPERSRQSEIVQRVKQTLAELGAAEITDRAPDGSALPGRWRWVLLNEVEWATMSRIYGTKTPLAFGNLQQRVTYVRASRAAQILSLELKRLLAHELGHFVCACEDQRKADEAADGILRGSQQTAGPVAAASRR